MLLGNRFFQNNQGERIMSKWVYDFGFGNADGNASMRDILGGKGANLAEMNKLGISVPPGFTISTKVCDYYYANEKNIS